MNLCYVRAQLVSRSTANIGSGQIWVDRGRIWHEFGRTVIASPPISNFLMRHTNTSG